MKNKLYLAFSFKYENILKIFCLCRYKIKLQQMVLTLYILLFLTILNTNYITTIRGILLGPILILNPESKSQIQNPKSEVQRKGTHASTREKKWIWAPWQSLIMGSCVLTSGSGKIANPWPLIGQQTVRSSQMKPSPGL